MVCFLCGNHPVCVLAVVVDYFPGGIILTGVGKDENQSKVKLIRIDGNTKNMKNNDSLKKVRFKSTYADVVRDGFN